MQRKFGRRRVAPDLNQHQAATGAGDTARRGLPGEAPGPLARPQEFQRAGGRAADRAGEPLRHLTAGGGCGGERIGRAIAAAVKLIFQFHHTLMRLIIHE